MLPCFWPRLPDQISAEAPINIGAGDCQVKKLAPIVKTQKVHISQTPGQAKSMTQTSNCNSFPHVENSQNSSLKRLSASPITDNPGNAQKYKQKNSTAPVKMQYY
jgi:hypothetical protein